MKNTIFDIRFNKKSGGIKSCVLLGDRSKMNFCKKGKELGCVRDFSLTKMETGAQTARAVYENNGVCVETKYIFIEKNLKITHIVSNTNPHPVYFQEGEFAIDMPLNDRYENSEICIRERCNAHIFTGYSSAYIRAERMGKSEYNLGIIVTQGEISSYSQEAVWHSNRGYFILNTPAFVLQSEESYTLSYTLFPYKDQADFFNKIKSFPSYLHVNSENGFTFKQGEEIAFTVESAQPIETVSCLCNGKEIAHEAQGNRLQIHFIAEQLGENKVLFTVNGRKSYANFHVTVAEETLIENRLRYIVEKQQCLDKNSPLYGAYLVYDTQEQRQYYSFKRRDCNACRERFGMAILLVKWLQRHENAVFYDSLQKFIEFLFRESLDEETGDVFDGIGKDNRFLRLYNAPWVALFMAELYHLTKEKRYAIVMSKILRRYYENGGAKFYPNGVRFTDFFQVLHEAELQSEYEELAISFDTHVQNIIRNGVSYPPHEVKFEQTIVTPAVTIMLDKYALSSEAKYLREAEKHLCVLRKFDGCQPDYHLNNIAIRFWDAYWFGKKRLYGDTFPHYWSVLSGYCYYRYGQCTKNQEALKIGEACIRNCTCLFFADGSASCAYLYPLNVNGERGAYFDAYANDQDFALYFLYKIIQGD